MPELPEVETTCRGIAPHIIDRAITQVIIRETRLRWPLTPRLDKLLLQQHFHHVTRRGKYLLLYAEQGCLLIHLGMSGNVRILSSTTPHLKHDHLDILFENNLCLRFNDPRRFGCVLWLTGDPLQHDLLKDLGPEPLSDDFTGAYLHEVSRRKKIATKLFIMNSHNVVGVGNIYANEALFLSGIKPQKPAGKVSLEAYEQLATQIKFVLERSIKMGGTTLRDFVGSDGKPGYFKQVLNVYDRAGLPCLKCQSLLKLSRLGQRQTVYCPRCQR